MRMVILGGKIMVKVEVDLSNDECVDRVDRILKKSLSQSYDLVKIVIINLSFFSAPSPAHRPPVPPQRGLTFPGRHPGKKVSSLRRIEVGT